MRFQPICLANDFSLNQCYKITDPTEFSEKGPKYSIPPYYSFDDSETQWLVNTIKSDNWNLLLRVISCNKCYLTDSYFQYPDSPEPHLGQPIFHRKAVLYLTPLALAIYLRRHRVAMKMMEYINENQEKVVNVNQACYVTDFDYSDPHVIKDDIRIIYPFCVMFRRECFECVFPLMQNGWNPQEEVELPHQRSYHTLIFHYKDVIEFCLSQMVTRPSLRLSKLLEHLIGTCHKSFSLLFFEKIVIRDAWESKVEDFVSISRRLLRYLYYYDQNLLTASQIIQSLMVIQRSGFYRGPRKEPSDIAFSVSSVYSNKQIMVNDQDNSIALILAICEHATVKGHLQSREGLLELLAHVLVDTKWYVHFLYVDHMILRGFFSNLTEKLNYIKKETIELARLRLNTLVDLLALNHGIDKNRQEEKIKLYLNDGLHLSSRNNANKIENEDKRSNNVCAIFVVEDERCGVSFNNI